MNDLLVALRSKNAGLSLSGVHVFLGGATHANEVPTIASSTSTILNQACIIDHFTSKIIPV